MGHSFVEKLKVKYEFLFSKKLYVFALMLLAIGLPVAPILVSISQFTIAAVWLIEGQFKRKIASFKSDKALQLFLLIIFVHVVWLLNSVDFKYAIHDLKIKLPLLVLPLVMATSYKLSYKDVKHILLIFVATVVVGTFICFAVYLGFTKRNIQDIREISIFISHIRFGLMIVLSVFILFYYLYVSYGSLNTKQKLAYILPMIWLFVFLFVLQSVTSWVVIFILAYVIIVTYYKQIKLPVMRVLVWMYAMVLPLIFIALVSLVLIQFFKVDKVNYEDLPKQTKLGNPYTHNINSDFTENGHFVWHYYSSKELRQYWPEYSDFSIEGKDEKGQPIKYTLVRYLASKNLTKDAEGLSQLDEQDIQMIESGYASCVYRIKFSPYVKLYEIVWELNQYIRSGNPNAKTLSMRVEYFKAGVNIFKENFWFGVGTGDVKMAFNKYYEETSSSLTKEYRFRAHNQYLTFALTFGVFGFVILGIAFIRPIYINKFNWFALSLVFLTIVSISMINEDTLETQSGATFFAFFYSLFVLRRGEHD